MSDERTRDEPATQPIPTVAAAADYAPGTRFGRYRLLRKLGQGGMGVVWLAEQSEPIRRQVALKLVQQARLDRSARARFELERQALALLAHPGIAQILDAGSQPDGTAWFAMERVDGRRLDDWWRDAPSLPARIELMVAVCRAVGHAHRRGIVHCDLKPANVLVVDDHGQARPKVIDFGIARAIGGDEAQPNGGTPGYMAPEQNSAGALDARADVHALGVCLRAALGLGAPAGDAIPAARPSRARREELAALLARATAEDPAQRYEDAHALADELERWLQQRPLAALADRRGYRWRCWLRRHRWPALAAGAFALLALVFSVQLWQQYRQTRLQRDTAEQVVRLLVDTFAAADPVQVPGGSASARDLLAAAAGRVQREALPTAVRLRLLQALGEVQHNLEIYPDARRSYQLAQAALAEDDTAGRDRIALLLARIDSDAEDYAAADAAAAGIAQRQRTRDPGLAADSLLLRADNALLRDEAATAAGFVDEAATLVAPRDHDRLRQLAVLRARIAGAQGEAQAAMRHQREALALAAGLWAADDLRTLDLHNDLAIYAGQAGEHAEAIAQLERVAALTAAAWGSDSAGLATVYGNLGVNRWRAGDAAGAEAEHRRAVAIFEQRLGRDSVHTGTEYNNLAAAIEAQGRASEALPWFERAEAALTAAVGGEHFRVGVTLHNHARARIASGDLVRARELLDRSAAILEPALGREHPRWQVWRTSEAEWRLARGDTAAALAILRETAPALADAFGAHSREARRAQELLQRALVAARACAEARAPGDAPAGDEPAVACPG
ncbi:MAG: serine/threonine protein kinase [Xanthomonadales bacterium]|nr:serine/threonine protein kinase [Xanthomonadales bacterium]